MKKLLILTMILVLVSCSLAVVHFDDVNNNKGCVILKIEQDSVGSIDAYRLMVKDVYGNYREVTLHPEYAELFAVGDTI